MHDLRAIKDDPQAFDRAMRRRGSDVTAEQILTLDEGRVANTRAMNEAQAQQKTLSKQIGAAKASGDEARAQAILAEVAGLKDEVKRLEEADRGLTEDLREALLPIPNVLAEDVPDGADESENVEVRRWGTPKEIAGARDHVDLGEALGMMDFEAAAKLSGSRFVVLKRDLAKLERALATFMLNLHTEEFGYEEVAPPVLVLGDPLVGTGQLPKFAEDLFAAGDLWLSPTAEVTLTNLVREAILSETELPKRMTAWTQCFRAEAGSAGRDTRGMIRMHQFSKVELVSITTPDASSEEHERMTGCAEEVLKRLELPFRTMLLCAGDTGFSAAKTYDLEVWLPAQGKYREISSCSNTHDFQARRMDARYRAEGSKKPQFVHTLNGSGLAVGRTLVAVLENYQNEDGSIAVPAVLQPLMGKDRIEAAR
ncbi:serine--tRNA ligase [Parvularcula dongshanensis]|uniref:Serine--tRNA ligase n=1 Tax=Parvularcula dongshanensis TaxID=1173995 RepID=A0A840I417_9PROT|nr:serine--tRNA ligase [Parvularcula dongshanensis]MBB4659072.1 seryl-tRNA synthetase [Parvularcula dongshanensis]